MEIIYDIALALVIVGAINWGLVSLFKFDLVAAVLAGGGNFGNVNSLSRIIYGLVAISGIYVIVMYLMNRF